MYRSTAVLLTKIPMIKSHSLHTTKTIEAATYIIDSCYIWVNIVLGHKVTDHGELSVLCSSVNWVVPFLNLNAHNTIVIFHNMNDA